MAELDVVALALVSAVLWGFEPIVAKRGLEAGGRSLQAAVTALVVSVVSYWLAVLLLYGPRRAAAGLDATTIGIFAVAGLFGTAIGRLGVFVGVQRVGASVNNAAMNTRPLFATAVAVVWLGEPFGPLMGVGVVVLVAGLVLLTLSRGGDIKGWRRIDLVFPVAAAAAFGLGNVVRRFGLTTTEATVLQAVTINETVALVALGGYVLARDRSALTEPPAGTYRYFAASGLLTTVALLALFGALDRGPVAVVDPVSATAPLFTTAFAYFLLRDLERVTRGIVAGVVLVVVGVAFIVGGPQLLAALV